MICKLKHETEDKYTKRETAKVQGSVFTQNKVLGFWKWQNEQMKKWAVTKFYAKKKGKKKERRYPWYNKPSFLANYLHLVMFLT